MGSKVETTFRKPRVRKTVRGIARELIRLFEQDGTFTRGAYARRDERERITSVCLLGGLQLVCGHSPSHFTFPNGKRVAGRAFMRAFADALDERPTWDTAGADASQDDLALTLCHRYNDEYGRNAVLKVLRKLAA